MKIYWLSDTIHEWQNLFLPQFRIPFDLWKFPNPLNISEFEIDPKNPPKICNSNRVPRIAIERDWWRQQNIVTSNNSVVQQCNVLSQYIDNGVFINRFKFRKKKNRFHGFILWGIWRIYGYLKVRRNKKTPYITTWGPPGHVRSPLMALGNVTENYPYIG